jgi:hypothetical protein
MTGAAQISAAIDADLRNLRDPRVRAHIEAFRLPTPTPIRLGWDYGKADEAFDGWLVFDDREHHDGIAFCDQGFGPRTPWGLINTGDAYPRMGMDSGWFHRFMDAYFEAAASALPIWRVARRTQVDGERELVTEELAWDEAWKIVMRLREEDPARRYDVEHDIAY